MERKRTMERQNSESSTWSSCSVWKKAEESAWQNITRTSKDLVGRETQPRGAETSTPRYSTDQ